MRPIHLLLWSLVLACSDPEDGTEPASAACGPPGASVDRDDVLWLSDAVGLAHYFSTAPRHRTGVNNLSDVLATESDWALAAEAWADALPTTCASDAIAIAAPSARVEMDGETAVVWPGEGTVDIPGGATRVLLDLSELPELPASHDWVVAALEAWGGPVPAADQRVRLYSGHPDQAYAFDNNVYRAGLGVVPWMTSMSGGDALPLAVRPGAAPSPTAARTAGWLRLQGNAVLVGEDLHAEDGEKSWAGGRSRGMWVHTTTLLVDGAPWPDVISADLASADGDWPDPVAVEGGAVHRPQIETWSNQYEPPAGIDSGPGAARASLVLVHAALQRFFPMWEALGGSEVGDEALQTGLDVFEQTGELSAALGEMSSSLEDGHSWVIGSAAPTTDTVLPLRLGQTQQGDALIVESLDPAAPAGDILLAVDGTPIEELFASEMSVLSGSPQRVWYAASWSVIDHANSLAEVTLQRPDGTTYDTEVEPILRERQREMYEPTLASGFIDEGRALYVDFGSEADIDVPQMETWLIQAESDGVDTLVLDLRNYPGEHGSTLADSALQGAALGGWSRVPQWAGPERVSLLESQWGTQGTAEWLPPTVVLLIAESTQSYGETLSQILMEFGNLDAVIGRPTSGANGNITGVATPSGYRLSFTGMQWLLQDKSSFHGIGLQPTQFVFPTADTAEAGQDEVLRAALDFADEQRAR